MANNFSKLEAKRHLFNTQMQSTMASADSHHDQLTARIVSLKYKMQRRLLRSNPDVPAH